MVDAHCVAAKKLIKVEANVGGGVKIPGQYGLWKWRFVKDTQIAQKFKSNPQFKSNL